MKSFLIIGMGSFGHHLCRTFAETDCEIMVADINAEAVEDVLSLGVSARIGDCSNPDVLASFGLNLFDACFVCMGTDFQHSLEITSLLKELGAQKVFAKADEDIQAKFLRRNGADIVIYPEKDIAAQLAVEASYDDIFDCIPFVDNYYIVEIQPAEEWIGKSIGEVNFRAKYNLTILATKKDTTIHPIPTIDYIFKKDEHLMVLGHMNDVKRVAESVHHKKKKY